MNSIDARVTNDATMQALLSAHTDITGPQHVDIQTARSHAGTVLWVNVNGVCVLRICQIMSLCQHLSSATTQPTTQPPNLLPTAP